MWFHFKGNFMIQDGHWSSTPYAYIPGWQQEEAKEEKSLPPNGVGSFKAVFQKRHESSSYRFLART